MLNNWRCYFLMVPSGRKKSAKKINILYWNYGRLTWQLGSRRKINKLTWLLFWWLTGFQGCNCTELQLEALLLQSVHSKFQNVHLHLHTPAIRKKKKKKENEKTVCLHIIQPDKQGIDMITALVIYLLALLIFVDHCFGCLIIWPI